MVLLFIFNIKDPMANENRRWLAQQLPTLRDAQIIDQATSNRLSDHYSLDELANDQPFSKFTVFLAAFGALFIGGGIIMLFAHNWDSLSRPLRVLLAITPLIISQALVMFVLFKKKSNSSWCEASVVLMFCTVPASIALVGQAYHISDDTQAFLSLWFILLLPFVYLLQTKLTACLMMLLATSLCLSYQAWYWLCVLALWPFYFSPKPVSLAANNSRIGWWFALFSCVAIPACLIQQSTEQLQWQLFAFISGSFFMYLLGHFTEQRVVFFQQPFTNTGALLTVMNLFVYTHIEFWQFDTAPKLGDQFTVLSILLMVLAFLGASLVIWQRRTDLFPLTGVWFFGFCFTLLAPIASAHIAMVVLANLGVLALGSHYCYQGLKSDNSGHLNFGLLIIMGLILLRFFDQDISFILRGLVLIVMGLALIAINVWHSRRRQA